MDLTERQKRIIDMGLSYLYSNLDDANDLINSDNEVIDQVFGIKLDESIDEEEVEKLREIIFYQFQSIVNNDTSKFNKLQIITDKLRDVVKTYLCNHGGFNERVRDGWKALCQESVEVMEKTPEKYPEL